MKLWQKYWLWGILLFFSFHLLRDILQDLKVQNIISSAFVKLDQSNIPWWYWKIFNTYYFDLAEIILASICLHRNKFEKLGIITIILAVLFLIVWLNYYFLL